MRKKVSKMKKYMSILLKLSGCITTLSLCVVALAQNSTCWGMYHQPKVPASLLEKDED